MEVVDLLLNLEFIPGDDVAQARIRYERAAQDQIAAEAVVPVESVDASSISESEATAASPKNPAPTQEVPKREPADPPDDTQPQPPTVTVQIIRDEPVLDRLSPPPSFEELVEQGWIRISWGRFSVSQSIRMAILRSRPPVAAAFRTLVELSAKDSLHLREGFKPTGVVHDVAIKLVTGQCQPDEVECISRPWVAARLWDATPAGKGTGEVALRMSHWVDRWTLLGCPYFALSTQLEPAEMDAFVDSALSVLTTPGASPDWHEFRQIARTPVALLHPHQMSDDNGMVPPLPATIIDRVQWMMHGLPEEAFHDLWATRASKLLAFLRNEVQEEAFDSRRLVPRLMDAIVERPVHLFLFVLQAQSAPALLADLLMVPTTSPLACSLIARWEARGSGWNRAFQATANDTTALLAFEDAVAVLGGHLDDGNVRADELAALYLHVYQLATDPRHSSRHYTHLTLLREEVVGAAPSLQDSVVAALLARAASENRSISVFCAALDLASEGGYIDRVADIAMVSTYVDVVIPKAEQLGVKEMDLKDAHTLVALALKSDATRSRFLGVIDVPAWLQSGPSSPHDKYTFNELLARRVRLHIRVLSRAIAGSPADIETGLVDALARTLHAGTTDQPQRGRIDAFALGVGYGMHGSPNERPIALDLAAALRRLEGADLQKLMTRLCQIEEPVVLAGIVANTPPDKHHQIKAHLETLTPQNSSSVVTLAALQARVDALLNAELPHLADAFIAAEREAAPGRAIPHRAMSTLRASLLALFVREDWQAIAAFVLPSSIPGTEKRDAHDTVLFFQALAELKKPQGDPAAAEGIFLMLIQHHGGVTAYHINLFASRVHRLLMGNALGVLSGDNLSLARRYLSEAQREVRPLVQHSTSDLKVLDSNRAMLLLAAGRPQESLQVLLELRERNFEARTEGFRALALARIGSKREALAVLTQAERVFGRTEFLSAIRENIDSHRPFSTAPSLSLDDDPVPGLRHALEALARLDHVEQAGVLQARGRLDLYLLEHVRGACASIVALAPMMKELGMLRHEDDITGVLKQVLLSRLLLVQWTVADQPRGGFSKTGGVGERDLVVSRGSVTLAVLEALIVDSIEAVNLTSHFTKLFGYDTCRFFFHITYARRANCIGIINHLKSVCTTPPMGINYVRFEHLQDFDSMPIGFTAFYNTNSRDVAVTFLALDMSQTVQRAAAASQ